MNQIPPEQLLREVDEVLRSMPTVEAFRSGAPETYSWCGRASAVAHAWDSVKAIVNFDSAIKQLNTWPQVNINHGISGALTFLHHARHDLIMKTEGPLSVGIEAGAVFDYFDEVRKTIETAKQDLFFVDAFLNADFVSRYLPYVSQGVSIRLLTREYLNNLLPAVGMFRQQHGHTIDVRSAPGFHDRYVIVDRSFCCQSGTSFKDGTRKTPTTLTQIVDAFPAVLSTYEALWAGGKVEA
jgi:hypothetical protein